MPKPDIVGLGIAILDVVLRLKDMPRWEGPGAASAFALGLGTEKGRGT